MNDTTIIRVKVHPTKKLIDQVGLILNTRTHDETLEKSMRIVIDDMKKRKRNHGIYSMLGL